MKLLSLKIIISLKMEPENDNGNIEYKLTLVGATNNKIEHLESQMRFRINEGNGEAIYVIGVTDDGIIIGLTDTEFKESFDNLSLAAINSSFTITILSQKKVDKDKKLYELLIREHNEQKYIDIKVAIAGNVDTGKSTLVGVLTSGNKDDGRGSARLAIFNFNHEVSSGRTSSVAQHILGFDHKGNSVNYDPVRKKEWSDIVKESAKVISLFDLCGHEKYLKTTIRGITSSFPDLCLILIGANMGITKITQEHIFLCVTLNIPFTIIITKIDICENRQNVLQSTINCVNKLLKMPGLRRIPYKINNSDDAILCAKNIKSESVVPIFHISSVTGIGIDYLKTFLNLLRKLTSNIKETTEVEYHIDSTFSVSGVGTVVGGQLISGTINVGDKLLLGPNDGTYTTVQVRSIQCKRVPLQTVKYGCYVCLGLKKIQRSSIGKGNVLISTTSNPISVQEFEADITILKAHSITIKPGYEPVIHTRTMRQTARLIAILNKKNSNGQNDEILRAGDKATVRFRFIYRPEYIKTGTKILMAEGNVKVIGIVL